MPRRVLVLSAAVGAGHLRAAQAVELALKELDSHAIVRNVDLLTLTNPAFRRLYGKAYLDLVNQAPHVLGYFYDLLDQPRSRRQMSDRLRLVVQKLNLMRFAKLLKEEPWDVIVNTHFLPAELIAALRAKGRIYTPQLTATTDFETHRLWVNQPCDHYFTATEEGALYLHSWGVPDTDTTVTGIPIHPVFSKQKDRGECQERLGMEGDRPVILQLSGGFGAGPIEKLLRSILAIETPLDVFVISGRNPKLKAQLDAVEAPDHHRVKIVGFTDQIDEYMAVADVVVTKPGGLTTSEVLARGAAMAIVNPIPGQESRNSDYLLENQAAIKINHVATLPHKLSELLNDPKRLATLKANARKLARPNAAFDVARAALAW